MNVRDRGVDGIGGCAVRWTGLLLALTLALPAACTPSGDQRQDRPTQPEMPDDFVARDSARIMTEIGVLASDSMEGRRTGEPGNELAREYIVEAFQDAGLQEPDSGFVQHFEFRGRRDTAQVVQGANVVGFLDGTVPELGAIVVTAHFDHLGVRPPRPGSPEEARGDSIFNGADDNASGTAALLSIARYMARNPHRHTMVFAALDAEEVGLQGARAFLDRGWPWTIALNVNLDMVSRSDSLLFAAGTFHYPQLRPILESVAPRPPVVLAFGHDRPDVEGVDDWTGSSDHRVFHQAGIPFVYFGVEDHPDYHHASDEVDRIDPGFYMNAVRTILAGVLALDRKLEVSTDNAGVAVGGS